MAALYQYELELRDQVADVIVGMPLVFGARYRRPERAITTKRGAS